MNAPTVKKATTIAWVTSSHDLAHISEGDDESVINRIVLSSLEAMGEGSNPWFRIGTAHVTLEMVDQKQMAVHAVEALRSEQQTVRADAERRANEIERQIQTLLAISYEAAEA